MRLVVLTLSLLVTGGCSHDKHPRRTEPKNTPPKATTAPMMASHTRKPAKANVDCLSAFKAKYPSGHHLSVRTFPDHYKIIVSHPSSEERTGGAEGYRLDRKTCKTAMEWHEHPQRIPRRVLVPAMRP